jgi:hypothetical protein
VVDAWATRHIDRWRALHPHVRYLAGLAALAIGLGVVFMLLPPMGTDLSAQVARADFVHDHGSAPIDLRWYSGISPYAYSLVSPWVMAVLGPRLAGSVAATAATLLLGEIFWRTTLHRRWLAGALGAVAFYGNLVSGRVTWAIGVAFGLAAIVLLVRPGGLGQRLAAFGLTVLACATSPVAGLFLGLAGTAGLLIWLVDRRGRARLSRISGPDRPDPDPTGTLATRAAPVLIGGAALPMVVTSLLFPQVGWMNISGKDVLHASVTALIVAILVPTRPLRIGALLAGFGVVASWIFTTPVGLNSTRLVTMFALPLLAAYGSLPDWSGQLFARIRMPRLSARTLMTISLVGGLGVVAWWQPPLQTDDLSDRGNEAASAAYYTPLLAELDKRKPIGRIEIPPTRDYWESAFVARKYPLARGWLRQVDLDRNAIFFSDPLAPTEYLRWLEDNGVEYVAVPDTELSWVASREIFLIRVGQPYLDQVWKGEHWTLYKVDGAPRLVDGATLVSADGAKVTFDATAAGEIRVRVRWSDWLTLAGPDGCLEPEASDWTLVRVATPGRYTLSSGARGTARCPEA